MLNKYFWQFLFKYCCLTDLLYVAKNEKKSLAIIEFFSQNLNVSLRKVVLDQDFSLRLASKVMRLKKWHPYKIAWHQELLEDDFESSVEFSDVMMNKINDEPHILNNLAFSDDATFQLTVSVNRHNFIY